MCYEPYIGEIMMWAGNYAPEGWAYCNGQTLSISQNSALYALIGNTYGGDARSTFNLPDLRGRVPMGFGNGPGLSPHPSGEQGGREQVVLDLALHASAVKVAAEGETSVLVPSASEPHTVNTMPPFQALSFVIALTGYWPMRP